MSDKLISQYDEVIPAATDFVLVDDGSGYYNKAQAGNLPGGGGGGTELATPTLSVSGIDSDTIRATIGAVANESNIQLQVSNDGSTGWADVPGGLLAANTTSFDHNGLPSSTTRYYRNRAVGDGVTYLTSPWSSVVSASTTAGGPTYLTWASLGRNVQINSNHGIEWLSGAGDAFATANQTLADGQEVVFDVRNVLDESWAVGVHTAGGVDIASWIFAVRLNVTYREYESNTQTDTTVAGVIGDLIKIKYAGTTLTIERSTNSGGSWTVISTYSGSATGTYNILFQSFYGGTNNIYKQ